MLGDFATQVRGFKVKNNVQKHKQNRCLNTVVLPLAPGVLQLLLLLLLPDEIATQRNMHPQSHQHKQYQNHLASTPDGTVAVATPCQLTKPQLAGLTNNCMKMIQVAWNFWQFSANDMNVLYELLHHAPCYLTA